MKIEGFFTAKANLEKQSIVPMDMKWTMEPQRAAADKGNHGGEWNGSKKRRIQE